jgi:hypothetical protein
MHSLQQWWIYSHCKNAKRWQLMKTIKQKWNPKVCCIHTNHSDFLSGHTLSVVETWESKWIYNWENSPKFNLTNIILTTDFFGVFYFHFLYLKNMISLHSKEVCWIAFAKFQRKIKSKLPKFYNQVPTSSQNIQGLLFFNYFHIWSIANFG